PFQHLHFYENDADTIRLSLPDTGGPRYFHYVQDALDRGAAVRVYRGDERPTLARRAPRRFYHVLVLETCPRDRLEDVAVNLLTREGMALCFETLAEQGVLCIHTSNRYLDIIPALADVAHGLGYGWKRGHTRGSQDEGEH